MDRRDDGGARSARFRDVDVTGLSADSRAVRPGNLFAALPGAHVDGRAFIADAIARGAAAVLAPPGIGEDALGDAGDVDGGGGGAGGGGIALITDANPRRRLALMAARFFGRQPGLVAAVTGTNGKTSVAAFTRQIWSRLGLRAASLGTLGITAPGRAEPLALTTLDPVALHRILAELAADGIDHLALEASSHGLDQYRLDGVRVAAAAFTNLSRDHLDYHADMADYLAAKSRLFSALMPAGGQAVLNADAPEWPALSRLCVARGHTVIAYGRSADPATGIRLEALAPRRDGLDLAVTLFGAPMRTSLGLIGDFQAINALCALGLAIACGAAPDDAFATLPTLRGAPGRLERVNDGSETGDVYVDYAHTPDALAVMLAAIRPHVRGRLVVVFGCGGDRDAGKRPLMGAVVARGADRAIVTDDNPRGEDPATIRAAILAAWRTADIGPQPAEVREIGDRAAAIRAAIADLTADDVLVIAGKGHERGQIVGDTVRPFDDADIARAAIRGAAARA